MFRFTEALRSRRPVVSFGNLNSVRSFAVIVRACLEVDRARTSVVRDQHFSDRSRSSAAEDVGLVRRAHEVFTTSCGMRRRARALRVARLVR